MALFLPHLPRRKLAELPLRKRKESAFYPGGRLRQGCGATGKLQRRKSNQSGSRFQSSLAGTGLSGLLACWQGMAAAEEGR